VENKRSASAYAGLIAWILATLMAGFARGAASTNRSISALHSSFPLASNSRIDFTRENIQSMKVRTKVGTPLIRAFDLG